MEGVPHNAYEPVEASEMNPHTAYVVKEPHIVRKEAHKGHKPPVGHKEEPHKERNVGYRMSVMCRGRGTRLPCGRNRRINLMRHFRIGRQWRSLTTFIP